MLSRRLFDLAQQLWSSPVFGDAFQTVPPDATAQLKRHIAQLYPEILATLRSIIAPTMPQADDAAVAAVLDQIAPKATAFCAAAAADGAADWEAVRGVVVIMALIYWADQSMDRGDEAMVHAVRALGAQHADDTIVLRGTSAIGRRVRALGAIHEQIEQLSRPEDRIGLWRCAIHDTLHREAWMWVLNREYRRASGAAFWDEWLMDVVDTSANNLGFVCATSLLYAAYRRRDPALPPLAEILQARPLMSALRGAGNAAIRVFDDIGDRQIDAGHHPEWGEVSINIVNEPEPTFVDAFLEHAGLDGAEQRGTLQRAFEQGDYDLIIASFVSLVRREFAAIPEQLQARYAVFLTLAKRIIEAGFVNMCGDIELSEAAIAQPAARA